MMVTSLSLHSVLHSDIIHIFLLSVSWDIYLFEIFIKLWSTEINIQLMVILHPSFYFHVWASDIILCKISKKVQTRHACLSFSLQATFSGSCSFALTLKGESGQTESSCSCTQTGQKPLLIMRVWHQKTQLLKYN